MADKQNRQHNEYAYHDICTLGDKSCGERVEYQCQDTARQTYGEETDVRKHITQNTRYIIIGIPQSRTEIHQRILARRVEEEHQHCSQTENAEECG